MSMAATARSVPATLTGDAVEIWWLRPDEDMTAAAERRLTAALSLEECARRDTYVMLHDSRRFALARGLLRWALARHGGGAAAACRIVAGPHGKPALVQASGVDALQFNVTHTDGLVAIAVARGWPLGIDAEPIARAAEFAGRLRRFLAPAECAALASDASTMGARFATLWTLKEAYAKARGRGLTLPFDRFAFAVGADGAVTLTVDPAIAEPASAAPDWRFALLRPTRVHQLAVATRGNATIVLRHWPDAIGA